MNSKRRIFRSQLVFFIVLSVAVSSSLEVSAQREVMYEQYRQNPMAVNPAFTGVREDFNLSMILRRRWITLGNSPVSQTFSMDGTVANKKIGLGLQALNDRMSPFQTVGIYGSVAYHHQTLSGVKLSAGVQGGVNVLPVFDQSVAGSVGNKPLASFGVGVWAQSDQFYGGVSVPEVLSQGFGEQNISYLYSRPVIAQGGWFVDLDEGFKLIPSAMVSVGKETKADLGARLWYNELVGVGAYFQTADPARIQISAEAMLYRSLRVGYIYNSKGYENRYTTNSLAPQGMHEIVVKFVPSFGKFHYN